MIRTYSIGDVHGCLDQLERLVQLCELDAASQRVKFIFLGDYIDRGPDSRGVIDYLINLQKYSPDDVICLRGNHEDMFLAALDSEDAEIHWRHNGADSTLKCYKATVPSEIPTEHIDWIRSLPLFHDDGQRYFAHAGINPARSLDQQRARDLLWIREPFLSSELQFEKFVVHGHTPTKDGQPDLRRNRLNIDTGAVFGRPLTSAVFTSDRTEPIRFLATKSALNR
jgi:serine/threonine protein phosphatase 1